MFLILFLVLTWFQPNLYIYKIVAILFLWTQTPPTILVIEGWNLGTNPAIVGGRPLTNFFEIGPRVPRLGPNFGQNLNKIAITREPLGRFGWNLDWRDIFKLYYHLNSMVKALKSTGIETNGCSKHLDKFDVWGRSGHMGFTALPCYA
jgi:hypothetical protein